MSSHQTIKKPRLLVLHPNPEVGTIQAQMALAVGAGQTVQIANDEGAYFALKHQRFDGAILCANNYNGELIAVAGRLQDRGVPFIVSGGHEQLPMDHGLQAAPVLPVLANPEELAAALKAAGVPFAPLFIVS